MATIDLSRHATDFRKHFTGVRMQQGRVLTDDDFNEHARLEAEDQRQTRVEVIGPAGSPDNGFLIANPVIDATTNRPTFTITAGTFYLGGQRLTLEADELFHRQRDWLQQGAVAGDRPTLPGGARFDFAYLEAWQQPVSAIEDSELLEVALGGPDTSQRVRNLRRVRVLANVASGDCRAAWAALLASLSGQGVLNADFELVPDARLQVQPDGTTGTTDLCTPPVAGGYLGAENTAIRVQLIDATHFTWGFDNAAPLYRVQLGVDGAGQRRRITMVTRPRDQAHWPLIGQTVELLPWSAVLPNGERIAELQGHLAKVTASYNPDTQVFEIDVAPPNDASGQLFGETWKERSGPGGDAPALAAGGEYFYLRVWDRRSDSASSAAIAFAPNVPVSLTHTGLQVTFSGVHLRPGDFWIIAARPDSPTTVVPWELLTNRRPHGVRRWLAPLAVISWPGGEADGTVLNDCRETFLPLTRTRCCCTVTVGDGNESHGNFTSIQAAVDGLPSRGGRVCVLPGRYEENVRLVNRHDIVISGCGPRTRIVGAAPAGGADPIPAIAIIGGFNLGLEDFAVQAFDTALGVELLGRNHFSEDEQEATEEVIRATLRGLTVSGGQRPALRARFVRELTVQDCSFSNRDRAALEHTVVLLGDDMNFERNVVEIDGNRTAVIPPPEAGAPSPPPEAPPAFEPGGGALGGLQIEGTSERVLIRDNHIRGGSGHGIILGSVRAIEDPADAHPGGDDPWRPIDPCSPKDDLDSSIEDDPENPTFHFVSTGPLEDIRIIGNRLHDLGGCGITVDRFWNLTGADEFITVIDLAILGNRIHHCLLRPILEPSVTLANYLGYGGIALADVEGLVVQDNLIRENGAGPREPVCGIFVLHGEGVEIVRNRIVDNGYTQEVAAGDEIGAAGGGGVAGTPKRGRRGGIVIAYALAPARQIALSSFGILADFAPVQVGEPAAKIHDNIVTTPAGQALYLSALGPVTVQANQFTTRGVVSGEDVPGLVASTVWILNLGLSNEIFLQHIAFSLLGGADTPDPVGGYLGANLDDFMLGRIMANGQVLFTDNQVNTDLLGIGTSFSLSGVLIVSLDDIGFHDNQCEANLYLFDDLLITHALIFGLTLRATGNRLKEGILSAFFSALTAGVFANTTALNQGTHCIIATGNRVVDQGNTAIVGPNPLLALLAGGDDEITCDTLQELLESSLKRH